MTTLRKALTERFTSTGQIDGQSVADRIGVTLASLHAAMKPLERNERHTGYLERTTTPVENWHILVTPPTLERLLEAIERDAGKADGIPADILDKPLTPSKP